MTSDSIKTNLKFSAKYVAAFIKWIVIAIVIGVIGGTLGSVFHICIDHVTELRQENGYILYFLPFYR